MEGAAPPATPEVPACLRADHLIVEIDEEDGRRAVSAFSNRMNRPAPCLALMGIYTVEEVEALLAAARGD